MTTRRWRRPARCGARPRRPQGPGPASSPECADLVAAAVTRGGVVLGTEGDPQGYAAQRARWRRPVAWCPDECPGGVRSGRDRARSTRASGGGAQSGPRCAGHLLDQAAGRGGAHARARRRRCTRSARTVLVVGLGDSGRGLLPAGGRAGGDRTAPPATASSKRGRREHRRARGRLARVAAARSCTRRTASGPGRRAGARRGRAGRVVRTVHHVDDFASQVLIDCQRAGDPRAGRVLVVSEGWRRILAEEYGVPQPWSPTGWTSARFGAGRPRPGPRRCASGSAPRPAAGAHRRRDRAAQGQRHVGHVPWPSCREAGPTHRCWPWSVAIPSRTTGTTASESSPSIPDWA